MLKNSFAGHRIHFHSIHFIAFIQTIFFNILSMSSHCFLDSMVSIKMSAFNLIEKWFFTSCFSFVAFKILSSSLTLLHRTMICLGMNFWFYLPGVHWASQMSLIFFIKFGKFWPIFFQIPFLFFLLSFSWPSHYVYIGMLIGILGLWGPVPIFRSSLFAPNTG